MGKIVNHRFLNKRDTLRRDSFNRSRLDGRKDFDVEVVIPIIDSPHMALCALREI